MITSEKLKKIEAQNNELMNNEFSSFTESEMRTIYSIAELYGGDNRVELVKELKGKGYLIN